MGAYDRIRSSLQSSPLIYSLLTPPVCLCSPLISATLLSSLAVPFSDCCSCPLSPPIPCLRSCSCLCSPVSDSSIEAEADYHRNRLGSCCCFSNKVKVAGFFAVEFLCT